MRWMLGESDLIISEEEADAALARVAEAMTAELSGSDPLVVTVMGGAVVFAGRLIPMLPFKLETDHLCATRYGDDESGGSLVWKAEPSRNPEGRTVVVLDDLLDEGNTLAEIRDYYERRGAARVLLAVWFDKAHGRRKATAADFVGALLPDRFVFGCGMDAKGRWRNLPEVRAMKK